ncbi:MAG: CtsR family transcriptional regulator [Oscillospiraceae bacterium]|nr:CtsR family transcriptional regulator [Oscillospiraceae bacterium]
MAAGMSDIIASFINEVLNEMDGTAELQRSQLASRFNCVPSQINYVISTRFSPEHGYIVESRRGGGGYIRISRVRTDPKMLVMHTVNSVGSEIDLNAAAALVSNLLNSGVLDEKTARICLAAIGNNALRAAPVEYRDAVRASVFKQILINLI